MSNEPSAPQTPARDDQDNEKFSTTEAVGKGGYPEESPAETQPDADPPEGREEQPQRDKG